jgi:hypothetical protein
MAHGDNMGITKVAKKIDKIASEGKTTPVTKKNKKELKGQYALATARSYARKVRRIHFVFHNFASAEDRFTDLEREAINASLAHWGTVAGKAEQEYEALLFKSTKRSKKKAKKQ